MISHSLVGADDAYIARNPDEIAISGIPAAANVALIDPTRQEKKQ